LITLEKFGTRKVHNLLKVINFKILMKLSSSFEVLKFRTEWCKNQENHYQRALELFRSDYEYKKSSPCMHLRSRLFLGFLI
jgi:hypothetical protein